MTARIPNFRGQRAVVLHRADRNCAALVEQLERLGAVVSVKWPATRMSANGADVVFFDSDLGFDDMFAWEPERQVLLVAFRSEAPGGSRDDGAEPSVM
jgi:AmiR/NasT family two-component response regulator